jgi:hypothetical protein
LQEPYEEIQANRGRLLVGQGRWEEALPLLEETSRSEKGKPGEFYYNLGYSTLWPKNGTNQQNDFEKPFAESNLRRARPILQRTRDETTSHPLRKARGFH